MAHEKVYAICENKCKEETWTSNQIKDYVGQVVSRMEKVATGSAANIRSASENVKTATSIEQLREYTYSALDEIANTFDKLFENLV